MYLKYPKLLPFLACFAAGLFSFYNLFQITVFNVISANLLAQFHLTSTKLGLLSAVYLLANTLWLIPGGMLLDRYSLRPIALIFAAFDIAATFIIAKSTFLPVIVMMRFVQGLASAMSLLVCTRLAANWFPSKKATAVGAIVAFALIGGMSANSIFAKMVTLWDWRQAMMLNGFMGLLFFLVMASFLRESDTTFTKAQAINLAQIKNAINSNNVLHGIYIGLMNLPIFLLATLWGTLFLSQIYKISIMQASTICALLYVGTMLGAPCMGFISDKINNRKKTLLWAALAALICVLPLMINIKLSNPTLEFIFFALGFFSSAPIVIYAALAEINPSKNISTASSLAFFIANLIGMLAQPLFGFLLNIKWQPIYINHVPLYNYENYFRALLILPLAFTFCWIISMGLTLRLKQ